MAKKHLGIGKVAEAEILKGATNREALLAVRRHFPEARTTIKCIQWYRKMLHKAGYIVPGAAKTKRGPGLRLVV